MPRAPEAPWTALLPGAVVFGVGLEVLHLITVYWIATQVEHKTDTYGAIGFALGPAPVGVPARAADHVGGGGQRDAVGENVARIRAHEAAQPGGQRVGHQASGHAAGDPAEWAARIGAASARLRTHRRRRARPGPGSWWRGWWRGPGSTLSARHDVLATADALGSTESRARLQAGRPIGGRQPVIGASFA